MGLKLAEEAALRSTVGLVGGPASRAQVNMAPAGCSGVQDCLWDCG